MNYARFSEPRRAFFNDGDTRRIELDGEELFLTKNGTKLGPITVWDLSVDCVFDGTLQKWCAERIFMNGVRIDDDPAFATIKAMVEVYVATAKRVELEVA